MKKISEKKGQDMSKSRIRSMTGFGKGSARSPYGTIDVEVKTLNHKSLSISCAPFEGFFLLEERMREFFEDRIVRGKVFVRVSRESSGLQKSLRKISINEDVIREYLKKVRDIRKKLGILGEVNIQQILELPGVIDQVSAEQEDKVWPFIKKALEIASDNLIEYREKEGSMLAKDFMARIKRINGILDDVKKYEKKSVEEYRGRLSEMIKKATGLEKVDNAKLEEEVALFARNCDIAEEIVRLENHLNSYSEILRTSKEDVGKRLDFIAQEMHREANTIGSKASDYRISNGVIEIKSEIEKLREQLKNIE